jgi:hypothetical protein
VIPILELIPVDANVDEAERVAHEDGPQRHQPGLGTVRGFEFQRHNGDDDGDEAVAEGFEAVLAHLHAFVEVV